MSFSFSLYNKTTKYVAPRCSIWRKNVLFCHSNCRCWIHPVKCFKIITVIALENTSKLLTFHLKKRQNEKASERKRQASHADAVTPHIWLFKFFLRLTLRPELIPYVTAGDKSPWYVSPTYNSSLCNAKNVCFVSWICIISWSWCSQSWNEQILTDFFLWLTPQPVLLPHLDETANDEDALTNFPSRSSPFQIAKKW